MNKTSILVVDDDPGVRNLSREYLEPRGHEVITADGGRAALEFARQRRPDAVVLDLDLPDLHGLEVLAQLKADDPTLPVVILTGRGDIPSAIRATELGAFTFLTKSTDMGEIGVVLQRALEQCALRRELESLRERLENGHGLFLRMGPSPQVQLLVERVKRVARSEMTVLLQGETGTGKELVARAVHSCSARPRRAASSPSTAARCRGADRVRVVRAREGRLHRGRARSAPDDFQSAPTAGRSSWTSIGDLPLGLQARLLRVLQERQLQPVGAHKPVELDVRIVAATTVDLREDAAKGHFRQDLYFRLAEFTIQLPPLRERVEGHRLPRRALRRGGEHRAAPTRAHAHACGARAPASASLARQRARVAQRGAPCRARLGRPGAVRRRPASCAGAGGGTAGPHAPPQAAPPGGPLPGLSLREISTHAAQAAERAAIRAALEAAGGNKSAAARQLRTDYKTLHLKIRQYGLR